MPPPSPPGRNHPRRSVSVTSRRKPPVSSAYQPRAVGLPAEPPEAPGVVGIAEVSGVLVAVPDEGAGVLIPGEPARAQRFQPHRACPPRREPGQRRGGDADRRVGGVRRQLHSHYIEQHGGDRDGRHGEEQGLPPGALPGPHTGHDQRDDGGERGHDGDELQHPVRDDLVVHRGRGQVLLKAALLSGSVASTTAPTTVTAPSASRDANRAPMLLPVSSASAQVKRERRDQLRADLNGTEGSPAEPVVVAARLRAERHCQRGRRQEQGDGGQSGCANTPARQQPGKHQGGERADRCCP